MEPPVNSPSLNTDTTKNTETSTAHFQRFDIVADESDHHLRTNKDSTLFTNSKSQLHKTIMKEWRILRENLPDSIYVRVYEKRIDLLRALIVGPAGTPYHDGLFVFDIAFPSDYPMSPPKVWYRSHGLRLNPNLYECGYVCLSIVNTWSGAGNERWVPSVSTVLQVLVSIQGLVLNEKPYFNEPGAGIMPGRVRKSNAYSEDAFVKSCKSMIYLLRMPPRNLESFVKAHFRERACAILSACNAYMNGDARVGYYGTITSDGSDSEANLISVSGKFHESMEKVYLGLVCAFTKNGSCLGEFIQQLQKLNYEKKILKEKMEKERQSSQSVFQKVAEMIKALFRIEEKKR